MAKAQPFTFREVRNSSEPFSDDAAIRLFAKALTEGGRGEIYLGGDPKPEQIAAVESAIARIAATSSNTIEWEEARIGSWWRKFTSQVVGWFTSESIGPKAERALEIQGIDRFEGQSSKSYAEAVAALIAALKDIDQGFLMAKNVIAIKVIDETGKTLVRGRVLTSAEVLAYERGDLYDILTDGPRALVFIAAPMPEARLEELRKKREPPEPEPPALTVGIG